MAKLPFSYPVASLNGAPLCVDSKIYTAVSPVNVPISAAAIVIVSVSELVLN